MLHPFDLVELMRRVNNVPTSVTCAPKRRYVKEDLRRWAHHYNVPFAYHKEIGQIEFRLMLRAAIAARSVGTVERVVAALFDAAWAVHKPLSSLPEIAALLQGDELLGPDAETLLRNESLDKEIERSTAAAEVRGVYGSPTFFVGEQMYFGNDRLDFVQAELGRSP